jgi:hypothetical protein
VTQFRLEAQLTEFRLDVTAGQKVDGRSAGHAASEVKDTVFIKAPAPEQQTDSAAPVEEKASHAASGEGNKPRSTGAEAAGSLSKKLFSSVEDKDKKRPSGGGGFEVVKEPASSSAPAPAQGRTSTVDTADVQPPPIPARKAVPPAEQGLAAPILPNASTPSAVSAPAPTSMPPPGPATVPGPEDQALALKDNVAQGAIADTFQQDIPIGKSQSTSFREVQLPPAQDSSPKGLLPEKAEKSSLLNAKELASLRKSTVQFALSLPPSSNATAELPKGASESKADGRWSEPEYCCR